MQIRPHLRGVVVSKRFVKDCRNEEEAKTIIRRVLDCSDLEFTELHKFEENIDGNLIFRAKRENIHIVYCVDRTMQIVFLRAIRTSMNTNGSLMIRNRSRRSSYDSVEYKGA